MFTILTIAGMLLMEAPDSISTATVCAERGITVSRLDTLTVSTTQTITDLMLQSPGVVVGDYGGIAGLKSINLRGLGSPHTDIYVDGIKVSNVQTGQPDLGMLALENYGGAVVDYAQNSVNFTTSRPKFASGRSFAGEFRMNAGSFGTILPYGRADFRLGDGIALSVNAAGITSRGDFPYGDGQRRANNDISQLKAGMDLFGVIGGGDWNAKIYLNAADRGTPGDISYPSTDRQADRNMFIQGQLRKSFTPLYSLSLSAKAAHDMLHYDSEWGDSDYTQDEMQVNAVQRFTLSRYVALSAVTSLQYDRLESSGYDAGRLDAVITGGAAFKAGKFNADLTIQYEGIVDDGMASCSVLSPSADLRYALSDNLDIIGFARRAYRNPTFNELYYPGYGNPDLKAEDALLTDLGADFHRGIGGNWTLGAKIDCFFNHLTDKITSAPTPENPSIWIPYNIGEVKAFGADADVSVLYHGTGLSAKGSARYSLQQADNVPYLSKHTVVLSADAAWKEWSLNTVWNLRAGRRDSYGEMPDWNTLDVICGRNFRLGGAAAIGLRLSCCNIFDCRYEMITGYPMQGRSIMAGITIVL